MSEVLSVPELEKETNLEVPQKPEIAYFYNMKELTNDDKPFKIDRSVRELPILGVTSWPCLTDAMKNSESIEKISMLDPISENSSKAIYEALKDHESVHTLIWQDVGSLDAVNAWWLAQLIEETQFLARLDLISKQSDKLDVFEIIMKALNKNKSLMWLTVEKLRFNTTASLKDLTVSNSSIAKLVLSKNHMSTDQFVALCEGLKYNHSISILDISHNSVGDEGVRVLSEILKKSMTLRTLNMAALNYTASGLQYLGEALKQNCALKSLKLSESYDLNDGAQFISNALKVNESLTSLKIHETFSADGYIMISEAIKFNRFLMELEFSGYLFDDGCLGSLTKALQVNTNVEYLGFKTNSVSDQGAALLIDMVLHNQSLTSLDLTYIQMTSITATDLFGAVQNNVSLLSLELLTETLFGGSTDKKTELALMLERNVLLQYERTLDMLVLFFNVARNPITFPKDIWRLIFSYYRTPGVPTFEPLLNDVFQDHSIRRVPTISKF